MTLTLAQVPGTELERSLAWRAVVLKVRSAADASVLLKAGEKYRLWASARPAGGLGDGPSTPKSLW